MEIYDDPHHIGKKDKEIGLQLIYSNTENTEILIVLNKLRLFKTPTLRKQEVVVIIKKNPKTKVFQENTPFYLIDYKRKSFIFLGFIPFSVLVEKSKKDLGDFLIDFVKEKAKILKNQEKTKYIFARRRLAILSSFGEKLA